MIIGRGGEIFAEVLQAVNELPGTIVNSPIVGDSSIYKIVEIIQFQIMQTIDPETGRSHFNIFTLVKIVRESTVEGSVAIAAMMQEEPAMIDATMQEEPANAEQS
jgi:hypothetical protein